MEIDVEMTHNTPTSSGWYVKKCFYPPTGAVFYYLNEVQYFNGVYKYSIGGSNPEWMVPKRLVNSEVELSWSVRPLRLLPVGVVA